MSNLLSAMADRAQAWLLAEALPLWSTVGRDERIGGFVEKIEMNGLPVRSRRRLRVSARQAYVFAEAGRLGWQGSSADHVRHAMLFLSARGCRPDGALTRSCWVGPALEWGNAGLCRCAYRLHALGILCG